MTSSDLRELDGWIAEKFMGGMQTTLCEVEEHSIDFFSGYCATCHIDFPSQAEKVAPAFSTNLSAFALVKREIERRGWGWRCEYPFLSSTKFMFEIFRPGVEFSDRYAAASEELAGCLAGGRRRRGVMDILTKQSKIKNVAQHWRIQYFVDSTWLFCKGGAESIYNQLVKLSNTATEEDIAKIIGNHSWTKNQCDDCGEDSDVVAIFAENNSEQITYVCPKCLRAALAACEAISSSIPT